LLFGIYVACFSFAGGILKAGSGAGWGGAQARVTVPSVEVASMPAAETYWDLRPQMVEVRGRLFLVACAPLSPTEDELILKIYWFDRETETWHLPDWNLIPHQDVSEDLYGPCAAEYYDTGDEDASGYDNDSTRSHFKVRILLIYRRYWNG
jgi:hypothetical protein